MRKMAKFLVVVVPSALPKTEPSGIQVKQILNPLLFGTPSRDRAPRNDSWTRGECFSRVPSRRSLPLLADCAVIIPVTYQGVNSGVGDRCNP